MNKLILFLKSVLFPVKSPVSPAPDPLSEAKSQAREIVLDAKNEALEIKKQAQEEASTIKEESLQVEKRLEGQKAILLQKEAEITKKEDEEVILDYTESRLSKEIGRKIIEAQEEAQEKAELRAKDILIEAMQRGFADYIAEYTVSKIKLPDEEMKGRIIGKEGRNIKAFEDATGVNLELDETPGEVRISCFDSVRREIAKDSFEKLILDGRIQPAKIEEIVARTKEEIERIIYKAGEDLVNKVGVYNLPKEIIGLLGRFKYRYSYGQNMIEHTLEEVKIGVALANELKADIYTTKLACLLHDIGKAVSEEEEGTHIELGVKILKKNQIPQKVIDAVAEHHGDKFSSLESAILHLADSISGARPGARFADYDSYVERMRGLEETAQKFPGVDKAYALSAGRELRVLVKADELSNEECAKLAFDIAKQVEKEHTFPGTVKIMVIKDYRVSEIAK